MQQVVEIDRRHSIARALAAYLAQVEEEFIFLLGRARKDDGAEKTPFAADGALENLANSRLKNILSP